MNDIVKFVPLFFMLSGCVSKQGIEEQRTWLAGDHHIHSEYSVGWEETDPPEPIIGGDAAYSITRNAEKARTFGLAWMVATDHGGPNHSKINTKNSKFLKLPNISHLDFCTNSHSSSKTKKNH